MDQQIRLFIQLILSPSSISMWYYCFKDNQINKTKSNMFLFLLVLASFEAPGLFSGCLRW